LSQAFCQFPLSLQVPLVGDHWGRFAGLKGGEGRHSRSRERRNKCWERRGWLLYFLWSII